MKGKPSDVIVIGAGAWGLATAYACLLRGLSVRVLEAQHPGAGASGGLVGALSPHVPDQWNPKKQFQYEALDQAQAYWARVAQISGLPTGYGRLGRIIPIKDPAGRDLAEARSANARDLWAGRYEWTVHATTEIPLNPSVAPFGVVHDTLSARIDPRAAVAALAAAIQTLGGQIETDCTVTDIEEGSVETKHGILTAERIFVASGVHGIDWLSDLMGQSAGGAVKGQAALLDMDLGWIPQVFDDGIYIIPHDTGQTAIGSTSENTWDHDGTDAQLDEVIAKAHRIMPILRDADVIERWAGFRPKAKRRDPMLGPIPGFDRVYAVLGAFKIGLGLIPKIGDLMADYAEGRPPDLPPSFTIGHHLK
ncbi:MAG: FAD-binding oxidoreductase [Pseudomonadota bacterium]